MESKLIIEFQADAARDARYAAAGLDIEVLYACDAAPESVAYDWEQVGVGRDGKPRNLLFRWLALRHALRHAAPKVWWVVRPPAALVLPLAAEAARAGATLTFLFDDEDAGAWFLFLVARAAGANAEAQFTLEGTVNMFTAGTEKEEAA